MENSMEFSQNTKNKTTIRSNQIRSVTQSCPTLCDPMNRSTPCLPVHHQFPDSTQTHVHQVDDAIQPSHPLLSPSIPALNLSQHRRIDAFELWCWRRLLRVPWTARKSNQSILKEISPEYSLEGLILKLKLQYFIHLWISSVTPGFPIHHQLPELAQTHVHHVSDAIQPSYPLLSPSPPAFNLSQHQGLFQ